VIDPNPQPYMHIVGECNNCGYVYALAYGFDCPRCHRVAFKRVSRPAEWKPEQSRQVPLRRLPSDGYVSFGKELSPYPHVLNNEGTACRWDCPACEWVKREKPAVDELDKMFALKDPR
jgi:rubredoxin